MPPPDSSHLPIGPTPDSSLQVPNNRREDIATELHYQHADEGLQDPIPIKVIMSLLEEYDDDTVATLRHMRSLESDYEDEDDAVVESDFTDDESSSSDVESFYCDMMDDEEEEDDYDLSTSDDELLDKSTMALLETNRSSPNHPIHSFKPEDILIFDKSDGKKPRKKKSANKPREKSMQKRRKCIVFGCTKNAYNRMLKCAYHLYPCSIRGCTKYGQVVSNNVRFCQRHAQTEAIEAYAQYRERRNRYIAERRRTDVKFRIAMIVRSRFRHALKAQGTSYQGKNKLLGCTVDQFKRYLEQFFSEPGNRWMNWDNHGRIEGVRCWEIDHIYPLSKLDLTNPEQLKRAQHWSNFQPLSAADNGPGGKFTDVPDGFEWNGDRWMWSEDSGRTNYNLRST